MATTFEPGVDITHRLNHFQASQREVGDEYGAEVLWRAREEIDTLRDQLAQRESELAAVVEQLEHNQRCRGDSELCGHREATDTFLANLSTFAANRDAKLTEPLRLRLEEALGANKRANAIIGADADARAKSETELRAELAEKETATARLREALRTIVSQGCSRADINAILAETAADSTAWLAQRDKRIVAEATVRCLVHVTEYLSSDGWQTLLQDCSEPQVTVDNLRAGMRAMINYVRTLRTPDAGEVER